MIQTFGDPAHNGTTISYHHESREWICHGRLVTIQLSFDDRFAKTVPFFQEDFEVGAGAKKLLAAFVIVPLVQLEAHMNTRQITEIPVSGTHSKYLGILHCIPRISAT